MWGDSPAGATALSGAMAERRQETEILRVHCHALCTGKKRENGIMQEYTRKKENGKKTERKQKPVDKWKRIEEELQTLRRQHLYRETKVIESAQRSHVRYQGRDMLMLASNSYLDFCYEGRIKEAAAQALAEYGTGSGGSRLTTKMQDRKSVV